MTRFAVGFVPAVTAEGIETKIEAVQLDLQENAADGWHFAMPDGIIADLCRLGAPA